MTDQIKLSLKINTNDVIKRLMTSLKNLFQEIELLYTEDGVYLSQVYQCGSSKKTDINKYNVQMLVYIKLSANQISLKYNSSPQTISQKYETKELASIYNSTGVKNSSNISIFADTKTGENRMEIELLDKNGATMYERQVNIIKNQNELFLEPEGLDSFTKICAIQAPILANIIKPIFGEIKLAKSTSSVYCKPYNDSIVFYVLDANNYLKGCKSIPYDSTNLNKFNGRPIEDVSECIPIPKPVLNFIKACTTTCDKQTNVMVSRNTVSTTEGDKTQLKFDFLLSSNIGSLQLVIFPE